MGYYQRSVAVHLDGTPIFKTPGDEKNEHEVASSITAAWGCEVRSFGYLSAIDWYAERNGRIVGVLELKSRSHASGKYKTVFLNVRKWLALTMASLGLGVPAIFVCKFQDCVLWLPVSEVDSTRVRVGGCIQIVKSRSDLEPVIEVAIGRMKTLKPH